MNPKFAAGIGAVVGMFLSPAAWVALLALTAGRAAINAVNGLTTNPLPPELGGDVPAQPAPGMPSWLTTLLLVSVVVTVLSALFFAWIGHTLARLQQNQHLPQQDRQLQHAG
jgi:ABC-type glycerol-3-phosphate transport system permease component